MFANAKGMIATAQVAHSQAVDEWQRRPRACSTCSSKGAAAVALDADVSDGFQGHGSRPGSRAAIVECSVPLARSTRSV